MVNCNVKSPMRQVPDGHAHQRDPVIFCWSAYLFKLLVLAWHASMYRSSIQPPLHLCLWLTGQLERPRFYCAAPHISLVALPPGAHPGFDLWSVPPLQKPVIPDMRLSVSFVGLYLACCQLLRVVVVFPITRYFCMFFPIFRYIFHVFVDQTGYLPPLRCLITSSRFCPRFRYCQK